MTSVGFHFAILIALFISLFQLGMHEDKATRMSGALLSRFLFFDFNRVKIENPSSHKQVVVNGSNSNILFVLSNGNPSLILIQNADKLSVLK